MYRSPVMDAVSQLLRKSKPAVQKKSTVLDSAVFDGTELDEKKDLDKGETIVDSAGDYASSDLALKAAAAVQEWAETDDLDEGEGLGDRLFSLLAGIADADMDGEINDDEAEVIMLAAESAWDYLESKGVAEDDLGALLNDFDNEVAARVHEYVVEQLPDGAEESADDIDDFVFGDGSDESALDSAGSKMVKSNTFAEACYDQNSIKELERALKQPADKADMKQWNLSEKEYFEQLKLALKAKKADGLDDTSDDDDDDDEGKKALDAVSGSDYRIENVQKVKLNGKNVILFKAYKKDGNAFVHVGQFSAPANTPKGKLWEVVEESAFDSALDAVYKKKLVIRKGKRVRINKRTSGKVRLSAKQKMSVRKMLRKSHNALATMRRKKSMRIANRMAKK